MPFDVLYNFFLNNYSLRFFRIFFISSLFFSRSSLRKAENVIVKPDSRRRSDSPRFLREDYASLGRISRRVKEIEMPRET